MLINDDILLDIHGYLDIPLKRKLEEAVYWPVMGIRELPLTAPCTDLFAHKRRFIFHCGIYSLEINIPLKQPGRFLKYRILNQFDAWEKNSKDGRWTLKTSNDAFSLYTREIWSLWKEFSHRWNGTDIYRIQTAMEWNDNPAKPGLLREVHLHHSTAIRVFVGSLHTMILRRRRYVKKEKRYGSFPRLVPYTNGNHGDGN